MRVGRTLLTPVVVAAALARERQKKRAAAAPEQAGTSRGRPRPDVEEVTDRSTRPRDAAAERTPGSGAGKPVEIPAAGWKEILRRTKDEVKADHIPLLAAGVAFYIFLALFPALIAAITVYGLVADPQQVEEQVAALTEVLPEDTAQLLGEQLRDISSSSSESLGWGLLAGLAGALFAASGGVQNLIKAINIAYDEEETRGFLRLRAVALLMTLSAIAFLAISVGLIAVLPVVMDAAGLGDEARVAVQIARWTGLVVFVLVALAVVYRFAPDRDAPRFSWVGLGSIVATVLWVLGSAGFSLYVSSFGSYGETYGALAGVVVLLLWLFLTSFIILLGAEINSETEHQTLQDSTKGPEQPMGRRRAVKADTPPPAD